MLTLEKFIASVIKNQYRKYGMYPWDNSTIPVRTIFLTEKQTKLYESLFEQRVKFLERQKTWLDGTWMLSKDGREVPMLKHKSGMAFSYTSPIQEKSFHIDNLKTNKVIWLKNEGQSRLTIKLYKSL